MKPKQAIEKVAAFIKWLAFDKKLHYFAGLIIAGVLTNFLPVLIAVAIAVAVGIAKRSLRPRNQEGNAGICRLLMDDRRGYNVAYSILRRFGHRLGVDKLGFYTSI